ncbi:MAG TPA: hypothetical protein VE871_11155 [Longimicrobium sp.]|nr:hypothetical protein [Longimicrobium sp.]
MQRDDRDAAGAAREDARHGREAYTRRIDCAPAPRQPGIEAAMAPPAGHGSGSRVQCEEA